MAFTSTTVCLLAGSVASRTFAGSTYRVGTSPAHGSVDVASDGMFTYSRTATTDRWADDPASFGSDEFGVVVRADGRDLAEIVVRPLLSTSARMPITSVRVEVVGGAADVYHRVAAPAPRRRPPSGNLRSLNGRHRVTARFGADPSNETFEVFVSDGVSERTSYVLGVSDAPLIW